MSKKWYKIKLSKLALVLQWQSPESKYYSNFEWTPFLQWNRTFWNLYPTFDTYTSKVTKLAKKWEVLMSVRAPVWDLNYAPSNLCIGRWLASLNAYNWDNSFLYYALKYNIKNLVKQWWATTFDSVNKDTINNFELVVPEDESDRFNVSKILSYIDSKIELNNKINSELEKMAKTLYDYWFVQFDFPDLSWKPYKSSGWKMVYDEKLKREIPEGWEVKSISDLLPVLTWKEDANFATKNWKYNFFTCWESILKCDEYKFYWKAILVAWNWNFNVKIYEWKFNAYQRTYVLIPDDEKYYTLIYIAVSNLINHFNNGSNGSIVKFIRKWDIEDIMLPLPKQGFNNLFNQLNTVTKKIEINLEENQKLEELRDWLLPMLMNGQVSVK